MIGAQTSARGRRTALTRARTETEKRPQCLDKQLGRLEFRGGVQRTEEHQVGHWNFGAAARPREIESRAWGAGR